MIYYIEARNIYELSNILDFVKSPYHSREEDDFLITLIRVEFFTRKNEKCLTSRGFRGFVFIAITYTHTCHSKSDTVLPHRHLILSFLPHPHPHQTKSVTSTAINPNQINFSPAPATTPPLMSDFKSQTLPHLFSVCTTTVPTPTPKLNFGLQLLSIGSTFTDSTVTLNICSFLFASEPATPLLLPPHSKQHRNFIIF